MQIDPNATPQAPNGSPLSEELNAPAPSADGRRKKKGRKVAPRPEGMADIADVATEQVAGSALAVIDSTDLDAVKRRLQSGAYNTREVAEVIARRLLASGDL